MNKELINLNKEEEKFRITPRVKILQKIIPLGSLLDLGCGSGDLTKLLSVNRKIVTGMDFIPKYIAQAKSKYPHIDFLVGDITNFYIDEKFDVILASAVLEHLVNPINFLKNIKQNLKENGIIILTVPNICSLRKRLKCLLGINPEDSFNHLHTFTKKEIIELIEEAGYKVESFLSTKQFSLSKFKCYMPYDNFADGFIVIIKKNETRK